MFRKILDRGEAGDNAGILLRGIEKEAIQRGMVSVSQVLLTHHTNLSAEVYVLGKKKVDVTRHSSKVPSTVLLPYDGRNRRH